MYRLNVGVLRYLSSIMGVIDLLSWMPTAAGLVFYFMQEEEDQKDLIIDTPFSVVFATVGIRLLKMERRLRSFTTIWKIVRIYKVLYEFFIIVGLVLMVWLGVGLYFAE